MHTRADTGGERRSPGACDCLHKPSLLRADCDSEDAPEPEEEDDVEEAPFDTAGLRFPSKSNCHSLEGTLSSRSSWFFVSSRSSGSFLGSTPTPLIWLSGRCCGVCRRFEEPFRLD